MLFIVEYDVITLNGKKVHFKEKTNYIQIDNNHFAFVRLLDGYFLEYNFKKNTTFKEVKNIKIKQVKEE